MPSRLSIALALSLPVLAAAQSKPKPAPAPAVNQVVKPPIAQAWVDLATHQSDIPGMAAAMMAGGGRPSLGSLLGGGKSDSTRGNRFGQTHAMGFSGSGQFLDVSVFSRNNPGLSEAQQAIPQTMQLGNALLLNAPAPEKPPEPIPDRVEDDTRQPSYEKPKGKLLLYWGCGETVRQGQPRVLDFANMNLEDVQRIMVARGSTPKGARSQPGVPAWPNKQDDRQVPSGASLAGENAFSGSGVPEGFRFQLRPEVDFMPAISLQRREAPGGATQLEWTPVMHNRGYFIAAMGAKPGASREDGTEMVMWTSSEQPDTGFALIDYQTPGGLERLLKEQIILAPTTTQCAIPGGILGGGAAGPGAGMLRMIAYGPEQSVAHPPRPTDPKIPWTPDWSVRVRTKSTLMAMLGMPAGSEAERKPEERKKPGMGEVLKGLFGR